MMALADLTSALVQHHIATPAEPLPPAQPGITWIWASNGIFKRGVSQDLDALICVEPFRTMQPGLAALLPHVRWPGCPQRLPASLLAGIHIHARRCGQATGSTLLRPIEQQYHILLDRERHVLRVAVPPQDAGLARVRYVMPEGQVLVDLHSHHEMAAYFSPTDDRDDLGLSVSAVIGRIYTHPELTARVNVYGHRQRVPATLIFAGLGPFRDTYGDGDATPGD